MRPHWDLFRAMNVPPTACLSFFAVNIRTFSVLTARGLVVEPVLRFCGFLCTGASQGLIDRGLPSSDT